MGFSCPVEQSTGPGRPRFYIPEEVIRGLRDVHGVWKEVANEVLVSYIDYINLHFSLWITF